MLWRGSLKKTRRLAGATAALAAQAGFCCGSAVAVESGASAWLPGQFASFAAVPGDPGFALETIYYHRSASASAGRTFSFGGRIAAGIDLTEQYVYLTPSYTFAEPVLHGQLFVGVTFAPGRMDTSVQATLTGPGGNSMSGNQSDSMGGIGDIYPLAMLKWNVGSHNFMAYLMPSIPAGAYDPNRIAGLGIGHWSLDGGLGYTYMNASGFEVSVTAGLTHNFMNPSTLYQSGMDAHIDWGASYSLTEELYLGAAGYFYNQVGADSGPGARLGAFQSKVAAVGPQVGYGFAIGAVRFDLNLRGYKEFAAENRPEGWNAWVTMALSAAQRGGK